MFQVWVPPDFKEHISLEERIQDTEYKKFANGLNQIWKILARKVKVEVKEKSDQYSLLYTPNGFCIPGGRFRELYYWDTYWIVNGLILSDMVETARGVIENIVYLVNKYGIMPNGARVYYQRRSQPPFLILMFESYYKATRDSKFVEKHLKVCDYSNTCFCQSIDGKNEKPCISIPNVVDFLPYFMFSFKN